MSDEVLIPLGSMAELDRALKDIVVEFEAAWDDKRETLKGHLVELQKRVAGVRSSWEELDLELKSTLEQNGS